MLPNIMDRRITGPNAAARLRHELRTTPPRTETGVRALAFRIGVTLWYRYRTYRASGRPVAYGFYYTDETTGERVSTDERRTLREAARDLLPDLVYTPADYPPTIVTPIS